MTPAEFDDLAKLARLALSPQEKETLRHQMEGILGYVEKLKGLDTSDVPPLVNVAGTPALLRKDAPAESLPPSGALAQAPKKTWDFFTVPQVLED